MQYFRDQFGMTVSVPDELVRACTQIVSAAGYVVTAPAETPAGVGTATTGTSVVPSTVTRTAADLAAAIDSTVASPGSDGGRDAAVPPVAQKSRHEGPSAIQLIFELYGPGEVFTIDDAYKQVVAMKPSVTRNAITTALTRAVSRNQLVKGEPGEYARPPLDVPEGSSPTDVSEESTSGDNLPQQEYGTLM
ncbi:MAG: hypothetical protein EKK42_33130 [Pseudonocardiaceae bacterium]|nr:MAG: hypothetical protein EKK42_33130 [Pseudonocardiaceae bacterium]